LTVNTVKTFAQTLKMMALSKELVLTSDFATKRDAYYQSKNWGEARFDEQTESDTVMDDIEAMFAMHGVSREQLRYIPDEHGGAVAGELIVNDTDLETGKVERIDCTRFGSGAYSIPSLVEHLTFETKAKFILCIETGGMFQRTRTGSRTSIAR
jgi:DNA topoisomerase-6 subunit A